MTPRFLSMSGAVFLLSAAVGCNSGTPGSPHPGSGGGQGTASGGISGTNSSGGAPGSGGAPSGGGTTTATAGVSVGGAPATGGNRSSGDSVSTGGTATNSGGSTMPAGSGGATSSGGRTGAGGTSSPGGRTGTGATSSPGGNTGAGGATSPGGTTSAGGSAGGGSSTVTGGSTLPPGGCDPGSATTTWASNCPTAPPTTCTAGTWTAGGPQNDPCCSDMTLQAESDHFAVYARDNSLVSQAQSAVAHLETVWALYFGSPMYMKEPFCNTANKIKANVHVDASWGLTGGDFDGNRMGMWIGTGGLADHWGLAHEFKHGVQAHEGGLACNQSNTCGWIYEDDANWSAQQQDEYHTTFLHCSEYLPNAPHLYLGSTRDRYCSWQFLEYLKDKYCYGAANAIWTGSPSAADPFTAIRNGMKWSIGQLNDFWGDWAMHNITWDYQDPPPSKNAGNNQGKLYRSATTVDGKGGYGLITDTSKNERRLRLTKVETLDSDYASNRRFISPFYWAPQRYGYNIVRLYPDSGATSVTVTFRGVTTAPSSPDWRWGLVATDSGITTARYSALQSGSDGSLNFCVSSGEALFLVVTATPSAWYDIVWDQAYNTVPRYPYIIQLANAWPDGFQGGKQDACPSGTARVANGGGCGPSGLASTVFVGPYALVTGNGVSGSAKIQDHAQVIGGKVTDATVGALTIFGSAFSATGASTQAMTTFLPLDFFEGRSLTGGALIGDVELRADHSSGTCSGFVDGSTCTAPGTDKTPAPPYTWRN